LALTQIPRIHRCVTDLEKHRVLTDGDPVIGDKQMQEIFRIHNYEISFHIYRIAIGGKLRSMRKRNIEYETNLGFSYCLCSGK
jgi:hypothetical protein